MKKSLLLLFAWLTASASFAQTVDVLHYGFMLSLGDENDTIIGVTNIQFIVKENTPFVSFDLASLNADGKGMQVSAVTDGTKKANPLQFTHKEGKLTIHLPEVNNRDTISVLISYAGVPADGLIISKNKFGERTFFADNWPNRARQWIPCNDRPDDKASFQFIVAAPSHYSVISNGVKKEETSSGTRKITRWQEDIPLPTKVMVIGVARFATKTYDSSPANLPISAWVYPKDSTKGFYDYALTPEIVRFFADYIAPFPYAKLANVQSTTIFGGMENASAIFYAENTVTGDRSAEDLMAHEIAHQWFGDMASEASFAHLWLSEGFATYFTNLYFEKKYGKDASIMRLKKERAEVIGFAKVSSNPVVDSTADLMSLLNANSYQKGSWILHMLRNEVGDAHFRKIIQTYYTRFKGGNAESRDFARIATTQSGKDLQPFFNQWLHKPGVPVLKINWKWTNNQLAVTLQQTQKDLFEFPLEIGITEKDGTKKTAKLNVRKKTETFFLPWKNKPANIILDPNTNLLFAEQ